MDHAHFSQDENLNLYAEVILPLALLANYTYRIPPHLAGEVVPGKRVAVQFGTSRMYSALVRQITSEFSSRYAPKEILEVLDDSPIVTDDQFRFWERSEEHTSELQSLMRISYAVFCLKKQNSRS